MEKRECPQCFEEIDTRAKVCPHCQSDIYAVENERTSSKMNIITGKPGSTTSKDVLKVILTLILFIVVFYVITVVVVDSL